MITSKKIARHSGLLHLSLLPFGIFSFVYVPSIIFVQGDISETISNLMENGWLFRSGIVSHLISQVLVVFLALSMYRLFKYVNKDRSVLMFVLALLGLPISFLNEVHNLAVLRLLDPEFNMFTSNQLSTQVVLFLDMSRNGVLIAQIFWGLWLIPLGLLVYKSGFLPKLLGILVLVAGSAYLFDSIMQLFFPGFLTISQFTFVFEIILPIWLLIKGVNDEKWKNLVPKTELNI